MRSVASSAGCRRSSKARVCVEGVTWTCLTDLDERGARHAAGERPGGRLGDAMRIDLNARIRTSDGHEAGKVHRVLIDPATERITGFVVSTGRLLGRDVIVGDDMLAYDVAERETTTAERTRKVV